MKSALILATIGCWFFSSAEAHHGKKYLVTGSYELPSAGSLYLLLATDVRSEQVERIFELEPGILLGITDRLSVEFHSHQSNDHGVWQTESFAIESWFGLIGDFSERTDELDNEAAHEHTPFGVSTLLEFEKGFRGHTDTYKARLIAGTELSKFAVAGNLIWEYMDNEESVHGLSYALGLKHDVVDDLALGLEVEGKVDLLESLQITPGVYLSVAEKLDLKFGASLGVHSTSGSGIIRMSLVYGLK